MRKDSRTPPAVCISWLPLLLLALALLSACRNDSEKAPPGEAAALLGPADVSLPELAIPDPSSSPPAASLAVSEELPAGVFVLPEGIGAPTGDEERAVLPGVRQYEVAAPLDKLVEFYRSRGYEVSYHRRGASVKMAGDEGMLHLLPDQSRKVRLVAVLPSKAPTVSSPRNEANR